MAYNLILAATVIVAVLVGRALGKNGPKWKAPLIALGIFVVAIFLLKFLGLDDGSGM